MRLLIIIVLLKFSFTKAQGFRSKIYIPNALNHESKAIFETTPNQYICGGLVLDTVNNTPINHLCIMGMDGNGQLLWKKNYGDTNFIYLSNPFVLRSFYKHGNFIFYTGSVSDSLGESIGVLNKFDLNGNLVWQKVFKDTLGMVPQMLSKSVDGGFLITGYYVIGNTCLLIKTDASGNELWRKKINKSIPNVSDGKAILQDSASKKIVIVGLQYLGSLNSPSFNDNVLILDSIGNKLYQINFTTVGGVLKDLIQTSDGKFVAVGYQYFSPTIGGNHLMRSFAVKFDLNNPTVPIWKIEGYDKLCLLNAFGCVRELSNGDLLISGGIDTMQLNNLPTNSLHRLIRLDSNGQLKWSRYYDYKTNELAADNNLAITSLELTTDGGWLAAVELINTPAPNPFFFVKYDSTGCDSSTAYCATVNLVGINEQFQYNTNFSIFPNPIETSANIKYSSNHSGFYNIKITELNGREIQSLEIESNKDYDLQLEDLPKGMYFISVYQNTNLIETKKLVR